MSFRATSWLSVALVCLVLQAFAGESAMIPVQGTQLKGEWELPNAAPHAVVVILQGSGNVGMNGDVSSPILGSGYRGGRTDLSTQLAETLASSGVASLRYDKRGFADASQLPNQTLPYLVSDAKSAMTLAKSRFPGVKTAFIGFSEGALVATLAAAELPTDMAVDRLYLFGLPSRNADELFHYQFVQWPVQLLSTLDRDPTDGILTAKELAPLGQSGDLPLLTLLMSPQDASWTNLDVDHKGSISIATQLVPTYEKVYAAVLGMMQSPAYANWYQSMKSAGSLFADAAKKVTVPVTLYQSVADAQISWSNVDQDKNDFAGTVQIRYFGNNLGHCFSPMDGDFGQIKTTGPIDAGVLATFAQDLQSLQ